MRRLIAAVLLLSACHYEEPNGVDQCLRREIFESCINAASQRPTSTTYNDSAELVAECDSAAYQQAVRNKQHIPTGCQSR